MRWRSSPCGRRARTRMRQQLHHGNGLSQRRASGGWSRQADGACARAMSKRERAGGKWEPTRTFDGRSRPPHQCPRCSRLPQAQLLRAHGPAHASTGPGSSRCWGKSCAAKVRAQCVEGEAALSRRRCGRSRSAPAAASARPSPDCELGGEPVVHELAHLVGLQPEPAHVSSEKSCMSWPASSPCLTRSAASIC